MKRIIPDFATEPLIAPEAPNTKTCRQNAGITSHTWKNPRRIFPSDPFGADFAIAKSGIMAVVLAVGVVLSSLNVYAQNPVVNPSKKATFAGGCFWCMQPFFDRQKGVSQTLVGYTGGTTVDPTYEQVSSGATGHAEAIEITYDPARVSYERLLDIYWRNIDPTVKDQQFYDHGTQYRTVIFYHDEEQKKAAEESKNNLAASGKFKKPIVVDIQPANTFYPAEEYHQQYYKKNAQKYERYHRGSGRDNFFKAIWGSEHN